MKKEIKKMCLIGTAALSMLAITGCTYGQKTFQTVANENEKAESSVEDTFEPEKTKDNEQEDSKEADNSNDEKKTSSEQKSNETEKKEEPSEPERTEEDKEEAFSDLGTLIPEVYTYFNTTYGDFSDNGGEEAVFFHGGRYIASCPNLNANVVFLGIWGDDTLDYTLEDSSEFLRLEGNVATFFTGEMKDLSLNEFLDQLAKNYTVTSEYMESANTAYYISDEDFLHIELTSKNNTDPDVILEIACKEDENISPDSFCWVEKPVEME